MGICTQNLRLSETIDSSFSALRPITKVAELILPTLSPANWTPDIAYL
jgi:hypothetical protein